MTKYTHQFCVLREVDNDEIELTLRADFDIDPFVPGKYFGLPENCYPDEGGTAQIIGTIMVQNDDGKFESWDGTLTDSEVSEAEEEGYRAWDKDGRDCDDYDRRRDCDNFHDGRAIHLGSGGKVFL